MNFNFDEAEAQEQWFKPEAGKRYSLTVSGAKEDVSKVKQTPFLKLSFQTDIGEDAYDKKIYNTPKALFRAQEWFKALGLVETGNVDFNPENLVGIKITAKCVLETYITDEGTAKEKTHSMVQWEEPEAVKIGATNLKLEAAKLAPKAEPKKDIMDADVPF